MLELGSSPEPGPESVHFRAQTLVRRYHCCPLLPTWRGIVRKNERFRRRAGGRRQPPDNSRPIDTACATIAPGKAKAPTTPTDINILHCTFGHTHEVLLKKTATQQGIAYSGELHECRGCSRQRGCGSPSRGRRTPEQIRSYRGFLST